MRPETEAAIEAVRRGLDLAQAHLGTRDVTAKDGRDIVTAADIAVEDLIRTDLQQAFAHPVVGEERGGEPPADGAPYWLMDPICGTRNFASGNRLYCINLALVQDGQVVAAAVGDPSRDEVLYAERGRGAWVLSNGATERLRVSGDSRTIVVEEGKSQGQTRKHAARFMAAVVRANRWDFRSLGTTLALPYLAAGRIAAYVVFYVSAVHSAAGSLLVEEAGGGLWDLTGAPWTLQSGTRMFSATADLRSDLLDLAASTIPRQAAEP
jgi:myo-inositol-1(or 4)-monophosphatase